MVIPARNEAESIGACLASVNRARQHLADRNPRVSVDVTVVLDRCDDGSAGIVKAWPQTGWVEVSAGNVGRARAVGVAWATSGSHAPAEATWIANTDADSQVPPDWLTTHVELADRGLCLVLGLVHPMRHALTEERLRTWLARHDLADGHPHVFGANLGVRASAYWAVRGFRAMAAHEDVDLVDRLQHAGVDWTATCAGTVATSARRTGRAPLGFAAALHAAAPVTPAAG